MSFNPENFYLMRIGDGNIKLRHKNVQFKDIVTTFGRLRTSNVILNHRRCSLNHCTISFEDGRMFVEDLGTSAGTFVNGIKTRKKKVEIFENSIVGMGADPSRPEHFSEPNLHIYKVVKVEKINIDSSDDEDNSATVSVSSVKSNGNEDQENQSLPTDNEPRQEVSLATSESPLDPEKLRNFNPEEIKAKTEYLRHYGKQTTKLLKDLPEKTQVCQEGQSEDLLEELETPREVENIQWRNGVAVQVAKRKKRGRPRKKVNDDEIKTDLIPEVKMKCEEIVVKKPRTDSKDSNKNEGGKIRSKSSESEDSNSNGSSSKLSGSSSKPTSSKPTSSKNIPKSSKQIDSSSSPKINSPKPMSSTNDVSKRTEQTENSLSESALQSPANTLSEKFPKLYQSIINQKESPPAKNPTPKIIQRRKSVFVTQNELIPQNLTPKEKEKLLKRWTQNTTQLLTTVPDGNPMQKRKGRPPITGEQRLNTFIAKRRLTIDGW